MPPCDVITLRTDGLQRTPEGFLKVYGYGARSGVLYYSDTGGEARLPEEVARADTLESMKNKPITDGHPVVNGRRVKVDSKNARQFQRGFSTDEVSSEVDPQTGETMIKVGYVITDEQLIQKIERGQVRQISPGYDRNLEIMPGEYKGQRYDGIQRDIVHNHWAILARGRAGDRVSLITDGEEEEFMLRVDGKDFETAEAAQNALDAALNREKTRADQAETDLSGVKSQLTVVQTELSSEKARADKAESDLKVAQTRLDEMDLTALRKDVAAVLTDKQTEGKSRREIQEAYIQRFDAEARFDGKDDQYVQTYFDITRKANSKSGQRHDSLVDMYNRGASGDDSAKDPLSEAYEKSIKTMMGVK